MFDLGFSEIVVVGAVALVVLGPEKLPVVAKTAGNWIGKAQRMVSQVKEDIERESELSELKKLKDETEKIADDISKSVKDQVGDFKKEIESVGDSLEASAKEIEDGFSKRPESEEASEDDQVPNWWESRGEADVACVDVTQMDKTPTIEELTEEVERLKSELGSSPMSLSRRNRKLAPRARSNRVRIYR